MSGKTGFIKVCRTKTGFIKRIAVFRAKLVLLKNSLYVGQNWFY